MIFERAEYCYFFPFEIALRKQFSRILFSIWNFLAVRCPFVVHESICIFSVQNKRNSAAFVFSSFTSLFLWFHKLIFLQPKEVRRKWEGQKTPREVKRHREQETDGEGETIYINLISISLLVDYLMRVKINILSIHRRHTQRLTHRDHFFLLSHSFDHVSIRFIYFSTERSMYMVQYINRLNKRERERKRRRISFCLHFILMYEKR